jgi:hypothetical protein
MASAETVLVVTHVQRHVYIIETVTSEDIENLVNPRPVKSAS